MVAIGRVSNRGLNRLARRVRPQEHTRLVRLPRLPVRLRWLACAPKVIPDVACLRELSDLQACLSE